MYWVSKYTGICIYNHKPQGCVLPSSCVYQIPGLKEIQLLWSQITADFFPKKYSKGPFYILFWQPSEGTEECVASASGTVPSITDIEILLFCLILCTHGTTLKAK